MKRAELTNFLVAWFECESERRNNYFCKLSSDFVSLDGSYDLDKLALELLGLVTKKETNTSKE